MTYTLTLLSYESSAEPPKVDALIALADDLRAIREAMEE